MKTFLVILGIVVAIPIGLALLPFVLFGLLMYVLLYARACFILADSRLKGPVGYWDNGGFYPIDNPNYPGLYEHGGSFGS